MALCQFGRAFHTRLEIFFAAGMEELFLEAEKTRMTLNPIPDHPAQHDRRRFVHARGLQRKGQADPYPEGLAGEPPAISESVASWDYHEGQILALHWSLRLR